MVHLIGILRRQRPPRAQINIVDQLPVDCRAQGQHLGGIFFLLVVFISGVKTLPPVVSRGIGHRPFNKYAPQIVVEKGVVFHAEAKRAGGAGVAAERQGGILAGGILRIGAIHADDRGADAQPQLRRIERTGHHAPVDAFAGVELIAGAEMLQPAVDFLAAERLGLAADRVG